MPALKRRIPGGGTALLLQALLWTVLSACVGSAQSIHTNAPHTTVHRLTGMAQPDQPPHSVFDSLTERDYQARLRRVVVAYSKGISFIREDPVSLFSDREVFEFARILAAEMPPLMPDQRLEFHFKDRRKRLDVVLEAYKDGDYLALKFKALVRDLGALPNWQLVQDNRAVLVPQTGQVVVEQADAALLKEPVRPDLLHAAILEQSKLDLIDGALRDEVIEEGEAERLRSIVASSRGTALHPFEIFFQERRKLGKAVKRSELTQSEFLSRLEDLISLLPR